MGKRHTLEFRVEVAPELVREETSEAVLGSGGRMHPGMSYRWKGQGVDNLAYRVVQQRMRAVVIAVICPVRDVSRAPQAYRFPASRAKPWYASTKRGMEVDIGCSVHVYLLQDAA